MRFITVYPFAVGVGFVNTNEYDDETLIWTPIGNPSIRNREKSEELFDTSQTLRYITCAAVPKDPEVNNNLLTL